MKTYSKIEKFRIVLNFFNFDCNKGMLLLTLIVFMRAIQLKKHLSNLSYPVLTSTHNDEKLHFFDSNSLVILSI